MQVSIYAELRPGSSVDRFAVYELVFRNMFIFVQLVRGKKLRVPEVWRAFLCGPVHEFVVKVSVRWGHEGENRLVK